MTDRMRGLRHWQEQAFAAWREAGRKGIAAVVTGGGKTRLALACLEHYRHTVPGATAVVVVPTNALLDQWLEEVLSFFSLPLSHVAILKSNSRIHTSKIHIGVINTVAAAAAAHQVSAGFLIVDECHRAASDAFRAIFDLEYDSSLGLSATPERPYDLGFEEVLVPKLGPVIARYTYREALADGVIVPFRLLNVVFDLEDDLRQEYQKITRAIQVAVTKDGIESERAVSLMLKRSRVANSSLRRVEIAAKLVAKNRGQRIIIFHEDIRACELLGEILTSNKVQCAVYHSRVPLAKRIQAIREFRSGHLSVLVACRALDEGFNAPEAEIAIIAASTATHRQRIQRLGRVLRPAEGKATATIYSIVASEPEIRRLAEEAETMEGVAEVEWSRA